MRSEPLTAALLTLCLAVCLAAEPSAAPSAPRTTVVISDLHMGLGKAADDAWHPSEDFRWPRALDGFLKAISPPQGSGIDLVIAGDFLELWQRPKDEPCEAERGCTVQEMRRLTDLVVAAHPVELDSLARFAARGNCVIVVPGNHDAALIVDLVWAPVQKALASYGGCVRREDDGIWVSADGKLLVEHGHQIGKDANKYPDWPQVTTVRRGRHYLLQPWGERFVQDIFNAEEASFPLIDNLSPSSAGVRYRMSERELIGTASDLFTFLRFNLFDTSLRQKAQILGEQDDDEPPRWDVDKAKKLGHRLIVGSLPADDPLAVALSGDDPAWEPVRRQFDQEVRKLPVEELLTLCDLLAIRGKQDSCLPDNLGAGTQRLIFSRKRIMKRHLAKRSRSARSLRSFVYGHTHSFEMPWSVDVGDFHSFRVANSGAFQRLVDDDRLRSLADSEGLSPAAFLRSGSPEKLPACYTSVWARWMNGRPQLEVQAWLMAEDDEEGRFVDPCGPDCPNLGHGCNDKQDDGNDE